MLRIHCKIALCFLISLFDLSAILKIRNGEHAHYVGLVVAYTWNREKQMFVALGKEFDMETAYEIAPSLCEIFNKSLRLGSLPIDWKLANEVPVFKKDNKEYAENYWPISLLWLISKVMERCVFNSIKDRVYSMIDSSEQGFITGRSCVTQLVEVLDYIGSRLDNGGQVDVIYLDMSKAFDKVSHRKLLRKLRDCGFNGKLLA